VAHVCFAVARVDPGKIDGDAQGLAACCFGVFDQVPGLGAIVVGVKLKPDWAGGGGDDFVDADIGKRAGDQDRAGCAGSAGSGDFGLGMHEHVRGSGRDEDGVRQDVRKDTCAGIDLGDVYHDARLEAQMG
jgi:hypothetical protein